MKNKGVLFLVQAAAIAALYVVLTWLASVMGLSSGVIQVRFSEALTILPFFTSAAIPGLFVGCILANFLSVSLSESAGNALHVLLCFVSVPMFCLNNWALSLFLWAVLLVCSLKRLKKK